MSASDDKQFLDSLAALAERLRADIEARRSGLDPSPGAVLERRRRVLVERDFWFFATTYFPHHVWGPPSRFQRAFSSIFPARLASSEGCKEWFIAPRGETKSTLITKIGPLFVCALSALWDARVRSELGVDEEPVRLDYIVLLGAETKMPTKLLEVVKTELEHNANLARDFPEVCGRGRVWRVGDIVTRSGVKIEPFGAEQAIRGTFHGASRPKVILGDDIITDAEAKSDNERDKRWQWLEKAIDYLGPPEGSVKVFFANTILNHDDPPSRAKKAIGHTVHHFRAIEQMPERMDLWDECERLMRGADRTAQEEAARAGSALREEELPSYRYWIEHREEMERGAVTSWPEVRSLYWLMRQRARNPRAFGTEMQGEPRTDDDLVFSDIRYTTGVLRHWRYFGAVDPSMGQSASADPSAILVGAWDTQTRQLHVIEESVKRRVPSRLCADLVELQREYSMEAIGFENNNAYEHMRQDFIRAGIEAGVPLPLVGITATVAQDVRIDSLEPFINGADPRILFRSTLTRTLEELASWPEKQSHHHYDALCALHLLWVVASSRGAGAGKAVTRRNRRRDDMMRYY